MMNSVIALGELVERALDEDSGWHRYSGERARKQQQGIHLTLLNRRDNAEKLQV